MVRTYTAAQKDRKKDRYLSHAHEISLAKRSRYANDPEYRESAKQDARDRYANDPEYRQRRSESVARYRLRFPERIAALKKRDREKIRARIVAIGLGLPSGSLVEARLASPPMPENCQLCGAQSASLQWDHDHALMRFRGWICGSCNRGLGLFGDSLERLRLAVKYLEERS